jgi:hypothetical protein
LYRYTEGAAGGEGAEGAEGGEGKALTKEKKERTIEEMKTRYYSVARRLLEARADNPEEAASHPIIKEPFTAQHEVDRKLALEDQMERTNALVGLDTTFHHVIVVRQNTLFS